MPLVAYDRTGRIFATLDFLVARTASGYGLVDLEATEALGPLRDRIWTVSGASGSGTWPEFIHAIDLASFRVELDRSLVHPIRALVHVRSGFRRERDAITAAIAARHEAEAERLRAVLRLAPGRTVRLRGGIDVSDITGTPERYLSLDEDGRTRAEADGEHRSGQPVQHEQHRPEDEHADHHGELEPAVTADVVDGRRIAGDGRVAVPAREVEAGQVGLAAPVTGD